MSSHQLWEGNKIRGDFSILCFLLGNQCCFLGYLVNHKPQKSHTGGTDSVDRWIWCGRREQTLEHDWGLNSFLYSSSCYSLRKLRKSSDPQFDCAQLLSHAQLFVTPWTAARQAPLSMGILQANTGVGCHALLQGIFSARGLNPGLLHCRRLLYHLAIFDPQFTHL